MLYYVTLGLAIPSCKKRKKKRKNKQTTVVSWIMSASRVTNCHSVDLQELAVPSQERGGLFMAHW